MNGLFGIFRARLPILTIVVAFLLLAAPLPAEAAQAGKVWRIGVLHSAFAAEVPWVEGLRDGLRELGLVEGRDFVLEHRFTEGDLSALPKAARSLVDLGVDLIYTSNDAATRAAKEATATIPIVFSTVRDPVAAGLVAQLSQPGANVTGITTLATELTAKRLELLKGLVPTIRRVWLISDARDTSATLGVRNAKDAAQRLHVNLLARSVSSAEELRGALDAVRPGDGFLVQDGPTSLDISAQILKTSLSARVPAIFTSAFWLGYGAFASYGADFHAVGRQAARLVAKILRGSRPQESPVEGANRLVLGINMKTANALGLTIPESLLLRADQIIE